ncbi:MAG: penicillin-binding protein 2 [Cocleimonas sp.]|nr:penicillin-binding protein 2 [Cocleimonas sp.]
MRRQYTSRSKNKMPPVYRGRRFALMLLLLAGIAVLLGRAAYIETFQQSWLKKQAGKRQLRTVTVPPYRGMIVDRNGESLAISSPVASVSVDPRKLLDAQRAFKRASLSKNSDEARLAKLDQEELNRKITEMESLLDMSTGALQETMKVMSTKRFHYLARHLEPEKAQRIADLNIPAVSTKREYKRFYPMAETTSHVVGFTNIDDEGIEGVEHAMNERLAGHSGRNRVIRDGRGRLVENIEELETMVPGEMVQLSIDHRIQYAAYKLLKGEVYKLNAKSGSVVVLDTKTGEVLAMANMPGFNPNDRSSFKPYNYRNRAVVDAFEPGSTLKPLTIAAALEARAIDENVSIETNGKFKVGKVIIKDPKNYGALTLSRLLAKSSNVGASKVALLMKPVDHWKFLNRVGFGRKPDAGFFSEEEGKLAYYDKWGKVDRASHGYGYGISASLLQLAHAYTVFANGGLLYPVSIYKQERKPLGQRVMSENNANAVLKMMRAVVQPNATGKNAAVDGYHVAGKTGTANKLIKRRYSKDHLVVSFIGVAPATNPRLVVAVMIDDPKVEKASGGRLAAPLFSKIMANSLRVMDVAPDNLPQIKKAVKPVMSSRLAVASGNSE